MIVRRGRCMRGALGVLAVVLVGCGSAARAQPSSLAQTGHRASASPSVAIAPVEVAYRSAGSGPSTVVLIHGGPGVSDPDLFTAFRPLAAQGFRVVSYDQRGVGATPAPADDDYGPDAYIADLDALRVRLGVDRLDLLGDSWGGEVAALYTAALPGHVDAVVDIGGKPLDPDASSVGMLMFQRRVITLQHAHLVPAPVPDPVGDNCAAQLNALRPVYAADPHHPYAATPVITCSAAASAATDEALATDTARIDQLRHALTSWHGRALIIQGAQDPFGRAFTDADVAQYAGAQVSRLIVPHAGHRTWLDDPTLPTTVERFLSQ